MSIDDLEQMRWAAKPKSQQAIDLLKSGAQEGDKRLQEILAGHVRDGVCDEAGKLLMRWDGLRLVRVADEEGRRDAA